MPTLIPILPATLHLLDYPQSDLFTMCRALLGTHTMGINHHHHHQCKPPVLWSPLRIHPWATMPGHPLLVGFRVHTIHPGEGKGMVSGGLNGKWLKKMGAVVILIMVVKDCQEGLYSFLLYLCLLWFSVSAVWSFGVLAGLTSLSLVSRYPSTLKNRHMRHHHYFIISWEFLYMHDNVLVILLISILTCALLKFHNHANCGSILILIFLNVDRICWAWNSIHLLFTVLRYTSLWNFAGNLMPWLTSSRAW